MCLMTYSFMNNKLDYTLWDKFAEQMNAFLNKESGCNSIVIILQLCKLNTFNGVMFTCYYLLPLFCYFFFIPINNSFIGKNDMFDAYHGTNIFINPSKEQTSDTKKNSYNKFYLFLTFHFYTFTFLFK